VAAAAIVARASGDIARFAAFAVFVTLRFGKGCSPFDTYWRTERDS